MRHPPMGSKTYTWDYTTLANPPSAHPQEDQWASSIYRGLVPVKNLLRRDFAVNGGIVRFFTRSSSYLCSLTYIYSFHQITATRARLPHIGYRLIS